MNRIRKLFLVAACLLVIPLAQASDLAKEKRWKDQVVGDLFDGEPIALNDGKVEFLGLITEAETPNNNAVVVLHGIGVHPDWPQIINPMRVQLAEEGWTTLSIQLPVLENEASEEAYAEIIPEAAPRIAAAIQYLRQNGIEGVYILAHSMGVRMASHYLANNETPVSGFIAIGSNVGTVKYFGQFNLPLLDVYGSEDLEGVLASAQDRARKASQNPDYEQRVVDGADHFFNEKEDALYEIVSSWLMAH